MSIRQFDEEAIFNVARRIEDEKARAEYLGQVCGENGELVARVEALLGIHEKEKDFLAAPPPGMNVTIDLPITEGPGTVIGRYKLLEQIGEGGFGVVYMAEQREPISRKVALKIIKPGMDTKEVIARFEAERQALAVMDHPHIARVLDAGATDSGRPYFVMELVRGIPITDYCDQNHLTPRERLGLFVSVCQAVQHAHQKGIIHRDVKPNNVLVTLHDGKPVVKVIDFGVAKAIDRRLTERTLFTRFSEMIGTPLYMSPEQAEMSGLDVDTRTDIYSLGVLLYELLTGATPFDKERLGKAAYDEIRRIIREEEPPKPSTRVSTLGRTATALSEHRKTDPKKLSALLKGDLDWIIMKSLEKDRTRRYDTAKDFADDVQHYLTDQPVEARAPSATYRLRKVIRRYRVAAATVAIIAATLVTATVFSTWMAIEKSRASERAQAEKEVAVLATERADKEAEKAREAKVVAERETVRAEAEAQKALKAADDAARSLEIVGAALGEGGGERIDRTGFEVLDSLVRTLDRAAKPNYYIEANLRPVIGRAYLNQWKAKQAKEQFHKAVEAQKRVYGAFDNRTVATMGWLVQACVATGEPKEAETCIQDYQTAAKRLGGREGAVAAARALGYLCDILMQRNEPRMALDAAIKSRALFQENLDADSSEQGVAIMRVAERQGAIGDSKKKISGLRDAIRFFERIGDSYHQWESWNRLGHEFYGLKELPDAKDAFSRALQHVQGGGVQIMQQRGHTAVSLSNVLFDLRDYQGAEKVHRGFLLSVEGNTDAPEPLLMVHRARLVLALLAQGKDKDAKATRDEAVKMATPDGQWQLWTELGGRLRAQEKLPGAKEAFTQALQLSDHLPAEGLDRRHQSTISLSDVLFETKDWSALENVHREFLRLATGIDKNDPRLGQHRVRLIGALIAQGKHAEAEQILQALDREGQFHSYIHIGTLFRKLGKFFEAKEAFSQAVKLAEDFGIENVDSRNWATICLCDVLWDLRDYPAMDAPCRDFIRYADGKLDKDNRRVMSKWHYIAWALHNQGRKKEADAVWQDFSSSLRRAMEQKKSIWRPLMDSIMLAGAISVSRTDEASLQDALKALKGVEEEACRELFFRGWWHNVAAELHTRLGQRQEAARLARIAWENAPVEDSASQDENKNLLVRCLRTAGQDEEAEKVLCKALASRKEQFGDKNVLTDYARADLAEFLVEVKKYAEAEPLLQQAEKALLADPRIPALQKQRIVRLLGNLYEAWGKPEQASLWRAKLDKASASEPNKPETKSPSGK